MKFSFVGRGTFTAPSNKRVMKSPSVRGTAVSYLALLAISLAIIALCVAIIESNNTFYQASGACACVLAVAAWCLVQFWRTRRGTMAHQISDIGAMSATEPKTDIIRQSSLRRFYGRAIDSVLVGGTGLTVAIIEAVLIPTTYNKNQSTDGCTKEEDICGEVDVEAPEHRGGNAAPVEVFCAVCSAVLADGVQVLTLPCQHQLHRHCGHAALCERNRCPRCQDVAVRGDALVWHMENESATPPDADSQSCRIPEAATVLQRMMVSSDSEPDRSVYLSRSSSVTTAGWFWALWRWPSWRVFVDDGTGGQSPSPTPRSQWKLQLPQRRPQRSRSKKSVAPLPARPPPDPRQDPRQVGGGGSASQDKAGAPLPRPLTHRTSSTTTAETFTGIV